ncbi:hypothetical protein SPSYN_01961 [Sporotomaculum syntrophicum]|uniref:Uncharacterized protein n=1 Tax=Sporotomaculum syntrophicum TaxID=182264 RepID=A0A9D3AXT6_9FIRM|nr:hypothetical protein [Sporotomaculum syntrophicum]KAF1084791.1 hypothetical protein SPSYN_01961 [Sporotomaculum syntrophicum]
MFGESIFFFYKALLFGIAAYAVIPRHEFKRYLIYGFIFGGIADVVVIIVLEPILNLIKYHNLGPFSIYGLFSFWTPVSWMFAFMIFFYFLPVRKVFLIPYIIGFSLFGYMVGIVLNGLGLFEYIGIQKYLAPIVFFVWFSISAYVYFRIGNIKLRNL